jgi:hypothetical protein
MWDVEPDGWVSWTLFELWPFRVGVSDHQKCVGKGPDQHRWPAAQAAEAEVAAVWGAATVQRYFKFRLQRHLMESGMRLDFRR